MMGNIMTIVLLTLMNAPSVSSFTAFPDRTPSKTRLVETSLFSQRKRNSDKSASCIKTFASVAAANSTSEDGLFGPGIRGGHSETFGGGKCVQIYNSYIDLLDRRPLVTKSVTTGAISALGDTLSQFIEARVAGAPFVLNWVRLNAFAISGGVFVGPYVHWWYERLWIMGRWLERKRNASKGWQTFAQVLTDQTLGVAVFFPAYFFLYEYTEAAVALRGFTTVAAAASAKMRNELMSIILTNYYIWPLFNVINFSYVPEKLRVLTSNIVSVFWNAYLCSRVA